jgi:hypothetical protein
MTGINSAVTGKFSDPPVIMTGITSRFISRPATPCVNEGLKEEYQVDRSAGFPYKKCL